MFKGAKRLCREFFRKDNLASNLHRKSVVFEYWHLLEKSLSKHKIEQRPQRLDYFCDSLMKLLQWLVFQDRRDTFVCFVYILVKNISRIKKQSKETYDSCYQAMFLFF